jgi:two-component sensor histidine kinase
MFVRDELVGALNLSSDTPNFFQPEHVEILKEIAISLAVAMRQADLFEQTQRDAETKALLLHDVNHRVMNNLEMILSILELEMERLRDQEEVADLVKGVLQDVCGRIHGIAIVHRLISNVERETLEPGNVVDRVIHAALGGSPIHDLITVMIDVADDVPPLSAKQAVALALITNELTTNSIKYAFADRSQGEIRVQIDCIDARGEEQKLRFLFRDDGPGLPEPEPAVEAKSMGLWLIRASATGTLRGEVEFRNDDGAVVEVRFPVESTQARAP